MLRHVAVFAVVLVGCRIHDLDLTGKACPCPADWFCDTASQTCTQVVGDASVDTVDTPRRTYRDTVLADSPIAYWRLDDDANGIVARDEMGHYDATYFGSCVHGVAGALVGDPSTAVHFDGTSCLISLPPTMPDTLAFPGTAPYTVEAWFKEASQVLGFKVIFEKEARVSGPTDGYALVDSTTGVYFERGVNQVVPTTARLFHAFGTFIHIVGVYDGTAFVMYLDAVPGAPIADTRSMRAFTASALIGSNPGVDYFVGELDEIAVYDHALSAQRVTAHHNAGLGN